MVSLEIKKLNELLVCPLCDGYFRDATTVTECLHTFCKSCIIKFFHDNNIKGNVNCPKCDAHLGVYSFHNNNNKILYDSGIQGLVDKIFPQLVEKDKKNEFLFYAERNIPLKAIIQHEVEEKTDVEQETKRRKTEHTSNTDEQKQLTVRLIPGSEQEADSLPKLLKPVFVANMDVKVSKIQRFVFKRLPEEDKAELKEETISISYFDKILSRESSLNESLNEEHDSSKHQSLILTYRKKL